ncbi:Nitric oxide reductase activation protein NorD [hydrothermal vent metagenome]|uniref:Nitric oxide reductase activation protein NorD n=1 Tax=hydrothermal vent metagenome TaxID=652676 RepID=A0A3B0ZVQ3_9ZZZZ
MQIKKCLSISEITDILDVTLDVEYTFVKTEPLAELISKLEKPEQLYILEWVKRVASINIELASQFIQHGATVLDKIDMKTIEAWALHAMDVYDQSGLYKALKVIHTVDNFLHEQHERSSGAVLEEEMGVLLHFAHGLSGRKLNLVEAGQSYTDTETIFLPALIAQLPSSKENFLLYKSTLVFLWAQSYFGTFRIRLSEHLAEHAQPSKFKKIFYCFETLRLEACIKRELPGLYRDMQQMKATLNEPALSEQWQQHKKQLSAKKCNVNESLALAKKYCELLTPFNSFCYQGILDNDQAEACIAKRIDQEKAQLKAALYKMNNEANEPTEKKQDKFDLKDISNKDLSDDQKQLEDFQLMLDEQPLAPPEDVKTLMKSIIQDLGEIPDDYLVAAGDGEYDDKFLKQDELNPDDVWSGTYHEQGAFLYNEWDFLRQHYRKNWCAVREKTIKPVYDDFVEQTKLKYSGLIKHLRKVFEAMRDEDRLLKRQVNGDGIDIDALVEALADSLDGSEMSDRLYTRMHRTERNIAVVFMVDMSGSTKGWINDAERESLIMLSETLETLGDRYAIYGFSGIARKRCEIYKIKEFDEDYNNEIKARIAGIEPQDYTRMGFAIRHLSKILNEVEAKTRILITISDGKPDDYDNYRGEYGIEDTRRALIESKRDGIHPYCITIDTQAKDYLSYMYGAAAYTVIDDVKQLPLKVTDIYRRLTT